MNPHEKIIDNKEVLKYWSEAVKANGYELTVTNGCFDLLHKGHVEYLYEAHRIGNKLLVLLNGDESIRLLKGEGRPINDEQSRALMLASMYFIDAVYIFNTVRCNKELEDVKPDVYVKAGDYNIETIDRSEKEALENCGTKIKFVELVKGYSTSDIIKKIKRIFVCNG